MLDEYKRLTVRDLWNIVLLYPDKFPLGPDTPIMSCDMEGNNMHLKHMASKCYEGIAVRYDHE